MSDEAIDAARVETEAYLSQLWGDEFESRMRAASSVAKSLGPKFMTLIDDSGFGNDRVLIQTLYRISQQQELK